MKQAEAINGTPAAEKKPAEAGASEGENVSKKVRSRALVAGSSQNTSAFQLKCLCCAHHSILSARITYEFPAVPAFDIN